MVLDYDNNDRSYLFGRLLAVLEKAERSTFVAHETHEPSTVRLRDAYVQHPMNTWKILEDELNPCFQQLSPNLRIFYEDILSKIIIKLQMHYGPEEFNRPLEELYLIGYYLQRAELNIFKGKDENNREKQ